MDAGGINAFLALDTGKFDTALQSSEGKMDGMGGKMASMGGTLAKGFAIGTAAVVAGGTAMFAMATKASDAGDRVDKMSQKIGVSATAFQELDYVLGQNGADVEVLQKGFQTLTAAMDGTTTGTGKGAEALKTLGISATDLNGVMKSQEEVFNESVRALMGMEEGVERSTLASELFGKKVAAELVPMLNAGVESFDELTGKAHDLGFVMDDESVKAAAAFNDSMDDIKKAMGGVMTKIGIELMPVFQSMMDWVIAHMPEIQAVIKKAFEVIATFVKIVVDIFTTYLLPIMQSIFSWVQENWPTISAIIKAAFDVIKFVWDNVLAPVLKLLWDGLKLVVDFVANNFPGMQKTVENIFQGIGNAVKLVTGIFGGLVEGIKKAWEWLTSYNNTDVKTKTLSVTEQAGYSQKRPPTTKLGKNVYMNANGTDFFKGGWSWVGEEGPELMKLPTGTQIKSNGDSMNMMNQTQTVNHTGTIRLEGVNNDGEFQGAVEVVVKDILRRELRI